MLKDALVRLGFRFADDANERLFVQRFVRVHVRISQVFLVMSGTMFALFFLWDRAVDPHRWRDVLVLRELILTPPFFLGALALFWRPAQDYLEAITGYVMTSCLAGFVVICATLHDGFRYGAAGMLLIYFGGAAMFPLRITYMVWPSLMTLFGYLGVEALTHGTSGDMLLVNGLSTGTAVVIAGVSTAGRELAARREFQTDLALESTRARVDDLLHSMLPREIVARIQGGETTIADIHGEVSIVFADLVGFTALSRRLSATQLVQLLNQVFSRFDAAAAQLGVERIKTIGDAYMAVGGLATGEEAQDHAERLADFSLAMREITAQVAAELDLPVALRIGLHVGPVVAGVIGIRKPAFDCWGDAVNMASRLEAASSPDAVLISEPAYERLRHRFRVEAAPPVDLKGIGLSKVYKLFDRLAA